MILGNVKNESKNKTRVLTESFINFKQQELVEYLIILFDSWV